MAVELPLWKQRFRRIADRMEKLDDCGLIVVRDKGGENQLWETTRAEIESKYSVIDWRMHGGVGIGAICLYLVPDSHSHSSDTERRKLRATLTNLFNEAGTDMETLPEKVRALFDPLLFKFGPTERWCGSLALFAIRGLDGTTLKSSRYYAGFSDLELLSYLEKHECDPPCFYVPIDGAVSGSVSLIDSIISDEIGRKNQDWTGYIVPKIARTWFDVESTQGWTTFANRFREEGLIENHPEKGPKEVRIHRKLFGMKGKPFPNIDG
jgi:hypothetical protein